LVGNSGWMVSCRALLAASAWFIIIMYRRWSQCTIAVCIASELPGVSASWLVSLVGHVSRASRAGATPGQAASPRCSFVAPQKIACEVILSAPSSPATFQPLHLDRPNVQPVYEPRRESVPVLPRLRLLASPRAPSPTTPRADAPRPPQIAANLNFAPRSTQRPRLTRPNHLPPPLRCRIEPSNPHAHTHPSRTWLRAGGKAVAKMSGEAWLYLLAVLINAVNLFLQVFFTIMYSDLEWYANSLTL